MFENQPSSPLPILRHVEKGSHHEIDLVKVRLQPETISHRRQRRLFITFQLACSRHPFATKSAVWGRLQQSSRIAQFVLPECWHRKIEDYGGD